VIAQTHGGASTVKNGVLINHPSPPTPATSLPLKGATKSNNLPDRRPTLAGAASFPSALARTPLPPLHVGSAAGCPLNMATRWRVWRTARPGLASSRPAPPPSRRVTQACAQCPAWACQRPKGGCQGGGGGGRVPTLHTPSPAPGPLTASADSVPRARRARLPGTGPKHTVTPSGSARVFPAWRQQPL
jgi:hypothetical protein